ncbi:2,3-diketo-L-gulonate-binding periplasmic protein YiaO precursor [Gimesia panareensis]|uniref:2,3-diketo-L-gulonate-binding periplasmic protein YiaO n=1 Tax=Gimesia panareensis TaxID=2527978 RepID=A0A517QC48_9PLAN|nr:TRAP transporter substrate-binding protein DctP [Gimesia panareensis]QDT29207.1 2,3-diketo-L-gulonate-binding periplasmic protein YiaO precursor [Gimesia panareensis]
MNLIQKTIRSASVLSLILCGALLCTSCGAEVTASTDQPTQWRFAIEETIGSVQHQYAMKFKELIEERSNGEIEVTIYPYGTLGTSDQITELVDMEVVQFAMASPGHLGKLIPEVQVFLLHFLFSDDDEINNQVLNKDPRLQKTFDELYARKRLKLLSIFSEGWQVWTMKEPVHQPEDFSGVKMRVMTSPLLIAAYKAYGASPTPLPYSEVYSGLQLNMIDGQENPVFAIQEMNFYEVTDWMIFARHAPFITTAVTNRDFFDSLPPERQQLVTGVVADLNDYILKVQKEFNQERLELIRKNKPKLKIITELTPDAREAFRKASQPVRDKFIKMTGEDGRELLKELQQTIQEYEDQKQQN